MMHKYGFKKSNFQVDEHGQYSMTYLRDVWDIPSVGSATSERLGYPTQKPERLLQRIQSSHDNYQERIRFRYPEFQLLLP